MITSKKVGFGLGTMLATALMISTGIGQPVATRNQETKSPNQTQAQTVTIDGKVSAVSEASVTVVDAAKAEKTIAIDANTKITKGGKDATAADIKADDAVTVVAKADGEALTAITIKVG
ncbi:MAG TPA: hypothetical protein VFT02_00275 [Pyrinomonadaceae bacterium]|nr:hypothetical protein [Pyrinomonadaceae bacterium]